MPERSSAELIPQRQRRRIGGAQVADRLRHSVVSGIGQRHEHYRRRVRKKADNTQQPPPLQQCFFHDFPPKKDAVLPTAIAVSTASLRLADK